MGRTKNRVDQWSACRKAITGLIIFVLPLLIFGAAMPGSAAAEETAKKDGWQFEANVYLWGASVHEKSANGQDADISFSDLVKNLKLGFMGGVGARNGNWSVMTDALYMDLKHRSSKQYSTPVGPEGNQIDINADAELKLRAWIVTPVLGYSIVNTDTIRLDIIGGARYLWVSPELDLNTSGPLKPRNKNISGSAAKWDGVGGIRGNVNLCKKWFVPYYVDLGAGDSNFTWQGLAGVGYKVNKAVDVIAAYRYLYYKFYNSKLVDNLDFSGPLLGVIYRF